MTKELGRLWRAPSHLGPSLAPMQLLLLLATALHLVPGRVAAQAAMYLNGTVPVMRCWLGTALLDSCPDDAVHLVWQPPPPEPLLQPMFEQTDYRVGWMATASPRFAEENGPPGSVEDGGALRLWVARGLVGDGP